MTAYRLSLVRRALLAAGLVCSLGLAQAQSTTRILVGFPPAAAPTPSPASWASACSRTWAARWWWTTSPARAGSWPLRR